MSWYEHRAKTTDKGLSLMDDVSEMILYCKQVSTVASSWKSEGQGYHQGSAYGKRANSQRVREQPEQTQTPHRPKRLLANGHVQDTDEVQDGAEDPGTRDVDGATPKIRKQPPRRNGPHEGHTRRAQAQTKRVLGVHPGTREEERGRVGEAAARQDLAHERDADDLGATEVHPAEAVEVGRALGHLGLDLGRV